MTRPTSLEPDMTKEAMNLITEQHILECAIARARGLGDWRNVQRFKQRLAEVERRMARAGAGTRSESDERAA